jgi:hypothetical protein
MHVAARPRIPDSAALTFARWAESCPDWISGLAVRAAATITAARLRVELANTSNVNTNRSRKMKSGEQFASRLSEAAYACSFG